MLITVNKRISMLLAMIVMAVAGVLAASFRISVEPYPGRSSINVGDKFYVTITLDNVNGSISNSISQLVVPGATVAYNSGYESFQSGTQSHEKFTIICRANQKGTFALGPLSAGGVRSNVVKYTIGGATSQSANSAPTSTMSGGMPGAPQQSAGSGPRFIGKGNGDLFLRASVSKTSAYEGEALVYTVKLYCSFSRIKFIGATAAPKFEGFVMEESKQTDTQLRMESYNGRNYATAVIARYIIFPQMTGNLKILGNQYTISVDEREYYRDEYFGSMSVSRPLQLSVSPNDLNINVKPLPLPKPADFSGGVGKFSISSSMPQTSLKTGQTASIVYTVTGSGNLKYITLPDLAMVYPKQIEVYSPQTNVQANVGSGNISGKVTFDYSLMPDDEGNYTIPEVKLVYFNPETGKYETSVARGYSVTVGKGDGSSRSQRNKRAVFDPDLMEVGKLAQEPHPYIFCFWYWLLFIVPVLLLFGAVFSYRKYLHDNADIAAVLSRKANKMARRRLSKAEVCLRQGRSEQFYDEMLLALWGYVSDKLKMPNSELTRENVSDVLTRAGVGKEVIDELIGLLDSCEFAKFSPESGAHSMKEVYDSGVDIINKLEESFKKSKKGSAAASAAK